MDSEAQHIGGGSDRSLIPDLRGITLAQLAEQAAAGEKDVTRCGLTDCGEPGKPFSRPGYDVQFRNMRPTGCRLSISQYVLKVCSRCDLACDHCYVYEHADQSWRTKPKLIATATVRQAARRIGEHAEAHQLSRGSRRAARR